MEPFFDRLQSQIEKELPFVCYHKPGEGKISAYVQADASLHYAQFDAPGFIFAPFNGTPVLLPDTKCKVLQTTWIPENYDLSDNARGNQSDPIPFERLVAKGIAAIEDGAFQKVVLSRFEHFDLVDFDPLDTFTRLASVYPTAFSYCFYHPKVGMWLGATPEKLLKVASGRFETVALAGTQPVAGDQSVTWAQKEQQEQQFVTDFIMENLESATTDIAFSDPYTYKAGNLLHLKTDITGTLSTGSDVGHLLALLHPTPAVCGLPRDAARQFILDSEGYDRKYYSGYLGELCADFQGQHIQTELFVNLRCMEIIGDTAVIYVGCGVTKDSDPQKEFIETVNKSMTIKKIL